MIASKLMEKQGIKSTVIDMHTIKPLDLKTIENNYNKKLIVSVEEHNIIGGLGTSIAEYLSSKGKKTQLMRIGVRDKFSKPGDYHYLLEQNRLTPEYISEDIIKYYNSIT